MPAVSKAQQRFMGMVHAAQKGDMENPSPEVEKAADSMKKSDAKDFASTKHAGLPHKKEEIIKALKERIRKVVREMNTTGNVQGYNTPKAFGKPGNEKKKGKRLADLTGYSVVNESNTLDKETIFKIYNVPKGAIKPSAKKERWGYSIKYTHPKTGSLQTGFLSNSTIEKYLKGNVKESIVNEGIWKKEYKGNDGIIWKKEKEWKEKANYVPYYKGHNIDTGGYTFGTEKQLLKFIDDYIVSNQIYNKYRFEQISELTERDVNRILQSTDNDEKLELTMDDGKKVVVQRVGKNSQGPTFKHIKNDKPVGTASALAASFIKNIKRLDENRWLELKNEEASAQAKIGRGISNINKQLKEMERFLNWYGKIKNESGVNNKSYWKRTNNHIYAIKERLLKLDQKIRQISE
jgi:hypothetical protein